LNDYYDNQKTILITTHQVEEIEEVLTDLIFINEGEIVLNNSMDEVAENFVELEVDHANKDSAMALEPLSCRTVLGGFRLIFERKPKEQLLGLGKITKPGLADIFVAKMQQQRGL
jgi:ABC-2 type transport system ATP-binding protein